MHVGKQDNAIATLVLLLQHEIVNLFLVGGQVERLPETGAEAVDTAGNIAGGSYQENVSPALVGIYYVTAGGVRENN